eukprot:m.68266 g.68266  ORF g.68266 m.68266 type:complete len:75 (+) comp35504_c0_seq2:1314-1538(+)
MRTEHGLLQLWVCLSCSATLLTGCFSFAICNCTVCFSACLITQMNLLLWHQYFSLHFFRLLVTIGKLCYSTNAA